MPSVLSVSQAKTHLNITGATYDAELQTVIDAAEAVITRHCGPLQSTATTARVPGSGRLALVLPVTPVLGALTSVTPVGGTALTLSDLYVDANPGLITYVSGNGFASRFYDVVYNAGRNPCPEDLLFAVKELVRHLWQTQRGPTRRPGSPAGDSAANTLVGAAHTLPFRVTELIGPHLRGGFA